MLQSVAVRNAQVAALESTVGTAPILRAYASGGSPPSAVSDAPVGTLLAEGTLPSNWLADPSNGAGALAGSWSMTGVADGAIDYLRLYASDGTTCHQQYSAGFASTAWQGSTAYTLGQKVSNGGNVYTCVTAGTSAGSGGPTGTGSGISDGTAEWDYLHPVPEAAFDNINVANGQSVSVSSFNYTAG